MNQGAITSNVPSDVTAPNPSHQNLLHDPATCSNCQLDLGSHCAQGCVDHIHTSIDPSQIWDVEQVNFDMLLPTTGPRSRPGSTKVIRLRINGQANIHDIDVNRIPNRGLGIKYFKCRNCSWRGANKFSLSRHFETVHCANSIDKICHCSGRYCKDTDGHTHLHVDTFEDYPRQDPRLKYKGLPTLRKRKRAAQVAAGRAPVPQLTSSNASLPGVPVPRNTAVQAAQVQAPTIQAHLPGPVQAPVQAFTSTPSSQAPSLRQDHEEVSSGASNEPAAKRRRSVSVTGANLFDATYRLESASNLPDDRETCYWSWELGQPQFRFDICQEIDGAEVSRMLNEASQYRFVRHNVESPTIEAGQFAHLTQYKHDLLAKCALLYNSGVWQGACQGLCDVQDIRGYWWTLSPHAHIVRRPVSWLPTRILADLLSRGISYGSDSLDETVATVEIEGADPVFDESTTDQTSLGTAAVHEPYTSEPIPQPVQLAKYSFQQTSAPSRPPVTQESGSSQDRLGKRKSRDGDYLEENSPPTKSAKISSVVDDTFMPENFDPLNTNLATASYKQLRAFNAFVDRMKVPGEIEVAGHVQAERAVDQSAPSTRSDLDAKSDTEFEKALVSRYSTLAAFEFDF